MKVPNYLDITYNVKSLTRELRFGKINEARTYGANEVSKHKSEAEFIPHHFFQSTTTKSGGGFNSHNLKKCN